MSEQADRHQVDWFRDALAEFYRQVPEARENEESARLRRHTDETAERDPRRLYINLLKRALVGWTSSQRRTANIGLPGPVTVSELADADLDRRELGGDWPADAQTMIGFARMENLQACVEDVLESNVPGDLIEAGVWRGGSCIFMRGILKAYDVDDRCVYVADSFCGLPAPNPADYPADEGGILHLYDYLAVSVDEVRRNFDRYALLDDQVVFVKGFFRDSLPALRGHSWSLVRLDGDMYESTIDSLNFLYDGLSIGGYLIVDDYGAVDGCRQAVDHFRESRGITEPMALIDYSGAFWQRTEP